MPKINAPSIGEHVANQEQRVFDEAIRLFGERGYAAVSFGDIAESVGLARNSLYRYFPSKADIVARWFRTELDRRIAKSAELLGGAGDPIELIRAWVDDQLDYAAQPEHAILTSMGQVEPGLATGARDELFGIHSRLLAPLSAVLARTGIDPTQLDATAELINGLVLSASRYELTHHSPDPILRRRLHVAIDALARPA